MHARLLFLILGADVRQAWRRAFDRGPVTFGATLLSGLALVVAEIWVVNRLGVRLRLLPEAASPLVDLVLLRAGHLIVQLSMMVGAASALSLALPILEETEADPWWGACPLPAPIRALQSWWRVMAGLAWVLLLAVPPLVTAGHHVRPGLVGLTALGVGVILLLAAAACAGIILALVLAALVPRRLLLPLGWATTTAAVVAAVLWLRHLHPERFITETDPIRLLASLAALGGEKPGGPAGWAVACLQGEPGLWRVAGMAAATLALLLLVWPRLAPRAAFRLASGTPSHTRPSRLWQVLDRAAARSAVGTLIRSRARLLLRDTTQAAQALYLLGLGVVYVENLRSLPIDEPLARELAGLVNLVMSGLLSAAPPGGGGRPGPCRDGTRACRPSPWRSFPPSS